MPIVWFKARPFGSALACAGDNKRIVGEWNMTALQGLSGPSTASSSATGTTATGQPPSNASAQAWVQQRQSFAKIFSALRQANPTGAGKALEAATGTPAGSHQGQATVAQLAKAVPSGGTNPSLGNGAAQPLFGKPGHSTPQSAEQAAAQAAVAAAAGASPAATALNDAAG
jgi:hypothetical protein